MIAAFLAVLWNAWAEGHVERFRVKAIERLPSAFWSPALAEQLGGAWTKPNRVAMTATYSPSFDPFSSFGPIRSPSISPNLPNHVN